MVAPPCTELDASPAVSLSRDCSSPTSPELSTKAPPPDFVPSISSEKRVDRLVVISLVCIAINLTVTTHGERALDSRDAWVSIAAAVGGVLVTVAAMRGPRHVGGSGAR